MPKIIELHELINNYILKPLYVWFVILVMIGLVLYATNHACDELGLIYALDKLSRSFSVLMYV